MCCCSPTQAMRDMSSVYPSKQSQVYPSCTRTHRPFSHPFSTPHSSARSPSNASYGSERQVQKMWIWVNHDTQSINQSIIPTISLRSIFVLTSWFFIIFIQGQSAIGVQRSRVVFRAVFSDWASNQCILTIRPTGVTMLTDITHSGIGLWMGIKTSFVLICFLCFLCLQFLCVCNNFKKEHISWGIIFANELQKNKAAPDFSLCSCVFIPVFLRGQRAQSMPQASPYKQQHSVNVVGRLAMGFVQVRLSVTVSQQIPWYTSVSLCPVNT